MNNRVLVDTHIWIWYLNGDETLSSRVKKNIDACAAENELYISAISIREIAMLVSKNKIVINTSCQAWVDKSLALPGVSLISLTPEIAIESCNLEGHFHGDPADRIIVASAKIENLCIISRDTKLCTYCERHDITVMKA